MNIYHIDTCLSCYHNYANEYTLQVFINNETTYGDVKIALKSFDTWSHLDYWFEQSDSNITEESVNEALDELFKNVDLTKVVDSTLEESDDSDDSVYMFFKVEL